MPSTYLHPSTSLRSRLRKEQHKKHRVYTGSGHRCGVIPYSSVWCGGLPLGLMMMSNKKKKSLARVCSWLVRRTAGRSSIALSTGFLARILIARSGPDCPTLGVASPIYRGLGPLPKCLGGKGSHNCQFEGGQLVQAILTKGGLRLPKALVVTTLWSPR